MSRIDNHSIADLFYQVHWSSSGVTHTDAYAGHQSNLWRDMLPPRLLESLMGKQSGDRVSASLTTEEMLGTIGRQDLKTIKRRQFCGRRIDMDTLEPRLGRFYPKGLLEGVSGIFRENMTPFRCISARNGHLDIDMGHPMAGKSMAVDVTVGTIRSPLEERGGSMKDWGDIITQGVGMQARCNNHPTDFFADQPFQRKDPSPDHHFYSQPRLVNHLDDTALDMVRQLYDRFIKRDDRVLDLMSSWQSHLPEGSDLKRVWGLGLNKSELAQNKVLDERIVHDLNADPRLPFDDGHFDVAVCTVSVEYLTSPITIFSEVARVLKTDGYFVVTFSNRWFEPKVIRIWAEMSEFERMGLVLEYFRREDRFDRLGTYSIRGLSRPQLDKYYRQIPYSDPVYAVWGQKADGAGVP